MSSTLPQSESRRKLLKTESLLNLSAVFVLSTIVMFWQAGRAAYVLLALVALGFLVKYRPQMPRDHRLYSWPIFGFFGVTLLSLASHGFPDSGINSVSSRLALLLIAVPLVSIFYLSYDPKRNVWIKFAVGCSVLCGLAVIDIFYFKEPRAGGGGNEATFGFIAVAMTSVVAASYHRFNQVSYGKIVFILAVLMGVCAMILSGTRTSWIAGLVVLIVAMFFYLDRFTLLQRIVFVLIFLGVIATVGISLPTVEKRIDQMIEMTAPYVKGEEQTDFTSLRIRIELWDLAWHVGLDNKLLGSGPGNTKRAINAYVKENPNLKELEGRAHIHNQFFQTFLTTGLLGILSLLALITCHFWLFAKYLGKRYSLEIRFLALAGVLLLIAYLVKCIPGVPFYDKRPLLLYGFSSAIIWGSLLGALRESGYETPKTK